MGAVMRAARLHEPNTPLRIDEVRVPEPGHGEVLVKVHACGVVPNMVNIMRGGHWRTLPPLPAIMGLDTAGTVAKIGSGVEGVREGDRVYVNPVLSCGHCAYCRRGASPLLCDQGAFQGYFGFRPASLAMLEKYPYGGYAEYTLAPAANLIILSQKVSFEAAARFGYLGTAFAGLHAGAAKVGGNLAVVGATGTLGICTMLFAMAMGVARIIAVARNAERLEQIRQLAPDRIRLITLDGDLAARLRQETGGVGPELIMDCLASSASSEITGQAIQGMMRGGTMVNIGALTEPLKLAPMQFMSTGLAYRGSTWFSNAQGLEMVALADSGLVDYDIFDHRSFALEDVNQAMTLVAGNPGGLVNVIIKP